MCKVYGYGRLALANNEEMSQQLDTIDNYCKVHGLKIYKCFFDNGVSGLELNRKELNSLIDILRGDDIVVIDNIARLSRSMFECITVLNLIENIGAKLIIVNKL
jgi:DNA invertase Pin-like site-specific DNA recombinase